jgi:hypothetical protein
VSEAADRLLEQLDATSDYAARQALFAGCPRDLLEQVHATLVYRQMNAEVAERCAAEREAHEAFAAQLDLARDDNRRLRIIEAARRDPQRGEAWLAEFAWRRTASAIDWQRRYVALLDDGCTP